MTTTEEGDVTAVRWSLIVEQSKGRHYEPRVVAEATGTREEAIAELEQVVADYLAGNEYSTVRRRLHRTDDGFFYVHGDGILTTGIRFSVAELISDSNDAKMAAAAEKRAAKERKAAERKARRAQRWMPVEDDVEDETAAEDGAGG